MYFQKSTQVAAAALHRTVTVESKLQLKKLFPECADWLAGFLIASHS